MRVPRLAALFSGGLLVAGLSIDLAGTAHASDPTVPAATWNEIYQAPFWLIRTQNDDGTDPLIQLDMLIPGTKALSTMCMAAGDMGDGSNTPLVATACQPFTDLSQILEPA
jgi:hypothetical protein